MSVRKIMSATREEFFRSLEHFAPNQSFDRCQNDFDFPLEEGAARVSFAVMPPRQVTGLLSLPQLAVSISFENVGDERQAQFLHAFDLAFRRGGG